MKSNEQVDAFLLSTLNDIEYFSTLSTCLQLRLADYAAQQCGCRSTRQIRDNAADDIEEIYQFYLNLIPYYTYECVKYINGNHSYRRDILAMSDSDIEELLETSLFNMIVFDCSRIFVEYFLSDE